MPPKILEDIGLSKNQIFGAHVFLYGTPFLTALQVDTITLGDQFFQSPLAFFEARIFSDYDFLLGLLFLILLDSLAGGLAAILKKNSTGLRQFSAVLFYTKMAKKLFGITIAVLCVGLLKNTIINGEQNILAKIVDAGFYSLMLSFEGASVLKNAYKVYPWEPIKFILKKLEIFNDRKNET